MIFMATSRIKDFEANDPYCRELSTPNAIQNVNEGENKKRFPSAFIIKNYLP